MKRFRAITDALMRVLKNQWAKPALLVLVVLSAGFAADMYFLSQPEPVGCFEPYADRRFAVSKWWNGPCPARSLTN